MGSVPFALSVHHFISSVGSDAGFAAIIGLAILILLYFAQARETASLRRHAYEAADRIQQLEGQVSQLARGQAAAAAPPAQGAPAVSRGLAATAGGIAVSRTAAPAPAAAGGIPSAPAGVAAPALTAATRLIPIPEPQPEPVAEPVPVGVAAAGTATASEPPAGGGPRPATVAGGNGSGRGATLPPPAQRTTPPGRVQLRQSGGTIPPSRRPSPGGSGRPPQGRSRSRLGTVLAVLAAALGVAVVVVVLLLVTGGSSSSSSTNTPRASNTPRRHHATTTFNTSEVTVAVLNGTATPNLAHDVAQQLTGAGYQPGTIATATDQTHPTTIVAYLPGAKRDALAVAGTLKLKPTGVQPVDASTQAVACPPPSTCKANVVVTVGSDLVGTAGAAGSTGTGTTTTQ